MSNDLPDFDFKYHSAAKEWAEAAALNGKGMEPALAKAYLELLEWRGLPKPLKLYPSIQLNSGGYFDYSNPAATPILPEDIAHATAKIARCGGHTIGDTLSYSVAQHMVLGSYRAPPGVEFEFLMHDAPEFVIGDMMTPLKQLCPDYMVIEARVERTIATQFMVPYPMSRECKIVDIRMAATEKRDIMPEDAPGEGWDSIEGFEPYPDKIEVWSVQTAKFLWLKRFEELWPVHKANMANCVVYF